MRNVPTTLHQNPEGAAPLQVDQWVQYASEKDENIPRLGVHRVQKLVVRRGERELTYFQDLGSTLLYPFASAFNFWAAGLYRVGEVLEICERHRENLPPERCEPDERLMARWFEQLDEQQQWRQGNRSTYGQGGFIQRDR